MAEFYDDFPGTGDETVLAPAWSVTDDVTTASQMDAGTAVASSLLETTYNGDGGISVDGAVRSYHQSFAAIGPYLELRALTHATQVGTFAPNNNTRFRLLANCTLNGLTQTLDGWGLDITGTAIRLITMSAGVQTNIVADTTTAAFRLAVDTPRLYRIILSDPEEEGFTYARVYVDGTEVFAASSPPILVSTSVPGNNMFGFMHTVQGDTSGNKSQIAVNWVWAGDAPLGPVPPGQRIYQPEKGYLIHGGFR